MTYSGDQAWQVTGPRPNPIDASLESHALRNFYLHPGQLYVGTEPTAVTTILGSCVAVCLWDSAFGIGGINHYLLPSGSRASSTPLRYGNFALSHLVEGLIRVGARVAHLQAKLFGGACVLDALRGKVIHLGDKNVEIAKATLDQLGIPIVAFDVGGHSGRKIIFNTEDGSAKVKLL